MTPRDKFVERAKQLFDRWWRTDGLRLQELMADELAAVERETVERIHEVAVECDSFLAAQIRREYLEQATEAQPR